MPAVDCGFQNNPDALARFGPTLIVRIGFDENFEPGEGRTPDLPENEYHALVDTGAGESCIDSALAATLNLPVVDRRPVSGVHGQEEVNVHLAQIYFPNLDWTTYGQFCGVHLHAGGQPHSSLIGRTFLRYFSMQYDGPSGSVIISR